MTDYDTLYAAQDDVCGAPFPELIRAFDGLPPGSRILDLGCGQGRDALAAARRGHRVVGVDLSPTGVEQMVARAESEALAVTGVVADIVAYTPAAEFDVVVLDRVLHMLPDHPTRRGVLTRMVQAVAPGGRLLIADERRNLADIGDFMLEQRPPWALTFNHRGFRFWQRVPAESSSASDPVPSGGGAP